MYVKFKAPYFFEGTEYEGIELDIDGLTGNDLEKALEILSAEKKAFIRLPEFDKSYCAQVAALASKKPAVFFRSLPVREYVKVTLEVQNFLLDGASEIGNTQ